MISLDGKKVRDFHKTKLIERVKALSFAPVLALIQVGDNKASSVYIARKIAFAEAIGAKVKHVKFPEDATQKEISDAIKKWNKDRLIHGIIVQLPLPAHIDKDTLIDLIDPKKDVDGLTSENQNSLALGVPKIVPATAKAVLTILDFYKIDVRGKKVAVLGRSKLVGSPTAKLLALRGATVTVCHSQTPNTAEITKASDMVISAIGKPGLIDASYVQKGVIIIDVGMTSTGEGADKRLSGDVNHESMADMASAMTPVPGGVGPVTVLCLFDNLIASAENYSS